MTAHHTDEKKPARGGLVKSLNVALREGGCFEPLRRSFNKFQHLGDPVDTFTKKSERRHELFSTTVVERYVNGRLGHVGQLDISAGRNSCYLNFLVCRAPIAASVGEECSRTFETNEPTIWTRVKDICPASIEVYHDTVFVWPGFGAEEAEEWIPSNIRLQSFDFVQKLGRNAFAIPFDYLIQVRCIVSNRKISTILLGTEFERCAINGLVQGMPHVINAIRRRQAKILRYLREDSKLENTFKCLRIEHFHWDAKATLVKRPPLLVKSIKLRPGFLYE